MSVSRECGTDLTPNLEARWLESGDTQNRVEFFANHFRAMRDQPVPDHTHCVFRGPRSIRHRTVMTL